MMFLAVQGIKAISRTFHRPIKGGASLLTFAIVFAVWHYEASGLPKPELHVLLAALAGLATCGLKETINGFRKTS